MKTFHFVSMFPEMLEPYLKTSIMGRAVKAKKAKFLFYNPVTIAKRKTWRIDNRPYGGGPGMVLEAEPFLKAWAKAKGTKKNVKKKVKTIFFTPGGTPFTQEKAKEYAKKYDHLIFICGHYEGVDERVALISKAEHLSTGPYTLTGGELPALTVADAVLREVKGVLGNFNSLETTRIASSKSYTRPEILTWKGKKYCVPEVLLSGDHKKIEAYKKLN